MLKSSDKNKLTKMIVEIEKNKSNALVTDNANKEINTKVKKYVIGNDALLQQHWDSSYQTLKSHDYDVLEDKSWTGVQYTTWRVPMGSIPEKLIPFLKIDFITNCSVSVTPVFSYFFTGSGTGMYLNAGLYYEGNSSLAKKSLLKAKLMLAWDSIPLKITTSGSSSVNSRDLNDEYDKAHPYVEGQPVAGFNFDLDFNYIDLDFEMFFDYAKFDWLVLDWMEFNYLNLDFDMDFHYLDLDFDMDFNYAVFDYVDLGIDTDWGIGDPFLGLP